ncbi:hypothetical protein Pmani_031759 [Petrolisthes manimaculis]|uniref:Uncharacterized protein n=1 Tax=Petrolisthes manimaculis TaxID=1843537 RepID=A0AAE1TSB6_9EUCA|nr:hypothetical protein Pmani_031759 [Petrolisthes manimaculis]
MGRENVCPSTVPLKVGRVEGRSTTQGTFLPKWSEGAVQHQVQDDEEEQQDGVGEAKILLFTSRHFETSSSSANSENKSLIICYLEECPLQEEVEQYEEGEEDTVESSPQNTNHLQHQAQSQGSSRVLTWPGLTPEYIPRALVPTLLYTLSLTPGVQPTSTPPNPPPPPTRLVMPRNHAHKKEGRKKNHATPTHAKVGVKIGANLLPLPHRNLSA